MSPGKTPQIDTIRILQESKNCAKTNTTEMRATAAAQKGLDRLLR